MPPRYAAINTVTVITTVTIFVRGSRPIVGTHAVLIGVCVCDVGPGGYRERVVTAVTAVVRTLFDPTNGAPFPY